VSPNLAIPGWGLVGAVLALALRTLLVHWLRKTAPNTRLHVPGVLEGITAALFAAFAYRFGAQLELLVFSALAATCVPLAALDLIARKLPNILVTATYVGVLPLLGIEAILNDPGRLVRALLSMTAALVAHGVLYAVGAIGGGDLKLVGVLAATLGWLSWTATWTGVLLGWTLGALVVLVGKAFNKARRPDVPLGLFLIVGTLTAAFVLGATVR
jgi:leader peptidase (prepilin peptidase)/N-methyltransferase